MPYKNHLDRLANASRYREKHRDVIKHKRKEKQDRNRQFVHGYLLEHPCVDCGERDIVVLEFDHRNPEDKVQPVSHMISTMAPISSIQKEIDKCDVRCANCHRRKTAKQLGWL